MKNKIYSSDLKMFCWSMFCWMSYLVSSGDTGDIRNYFIFLMSLWTHMMIAFCVYIRCEGVQCMYWERRRGRAKEKIGGEKKWIVRVLCWVWGGDDPLSVCQTFLRIAVPHSSYWCQRNYANIAWNQSHMRMTYFSTLTHTHTYTYSISQTRTQAENCT